MNKQKFSGLLAVVMIAAVAAFNVSLNSQKETLSDLAMENVEALADESGGGYSCTVTSKCYDLLTEDGSVSCTGQKCSRGKGWVECDDNRTDCKS